MGFGNKLLWYYRHAKIFPLADIPRYRRAKNATSGEPVSVRVRAIGCKPLLVRPGTSDGMVMWETFGRLFHLPPMKLRPDAVILDLGANVGYTAAHFAALYPKGRVIAVEMDAGNAEMARRNTQAFANIELVRAAIWKEDGELSYGGDSEHGYSVVAVASKTAPALSIDTLIRSRGLGTIDYVKMDIEGAEDEVLRGDLDWLKQVQSINVEVHEPATIEGVKAVLERHGLVARVDGRQDFVVSGVRRG